MARMYCGFASRAAQNYTLIASVMRALGAEFRRKRMKNNGLEL